MNVDRTESLVSRLYLGATFIVFGGLVGLVGLIPVLSGHPVYARGGYTIEPGFALAIAALLLTIGLVFVGWAIVGKFRAKR